MNKILIVDDSKAARLALSSYLDKDVFEVMTAESAGAGLKVLEHWMPDCILTDFEMPEMDGPALCRHLKNNQRYKHIPVIVLTSMSASENLVIAIESGADDFISKASDVRVIRAKIMAMVRIKNFQDDIMRQRRVEGMKQIIGTYNHEFNNPLTIAIGNINWLKKNASGEEQLARINRVSEALERMVGLVKKIRDLRDYIDQSYTETENTVDLKDDEPDKADPKADESQHEG